MKFTFKDGWIILNPPPIGNTYFGKTASKICMVFIKAPHLDYQMQVDYLKSLKQ